jgi:hypothetical protein
VGIPEKGEILGSRGVCTNGMLWDVFEVLCWEIRCVCDGAEVGNERSIDISERVPVYSIEEWMSLDLVHSIACLLRSDEPRGGKYVYTEVLASM